MYIYIWVVNHWISGMHLQVGEIFASPKNCKASKVNFKFAQSKLFQFKVRTLSFPGRLGPGHDPSYNLLT
jgi:hypothetical protein